MIVGRKCALSPDRGEQCYQDYRMWLLACERYKPSVLAKKYGVSKTAILAYGKRRHKRRRAA